MMAMVMVTLVFRCEQAVLTYNVWGFCPFAFFSLLQVYVNNTGWIPNTVTYSGVILCKWRYPDVAKPKLDIMCVEGERWDSCRVLIQNVTNEKKGTVKLPTNTHSQICECLASWHSASTLVFNLQWLLWCIILTVWPNLWHLSGIYLIYFL